MSAIDRSSTNGSDRPLLRRLTKSLVVVIVIIPYVALGLYLASKELGHRAMKISSGTYGGLYYKLGDELANILNDGFEGKITFTNIESRGSIENTERITKDQAQLAFAQDGLIAGSNVAALARLYISPLQIVVAKAGPLKNISELKTKGIKFTVYIGEAGSGTRTVSTTVLSHYGISLSDVAVIGDNWSFDEAADALMRGDIEAAFFLTGYGAPAVEKIANDVKARFTLLDLERVPGMTTAYPYLEATTISKASYPSSAKFPDREIHTVATRELLICSRQMSEREAYKIVDVLFKSSSRIVRNFTLLTQLSRIEPERNFYYPLHPGAVAYYTRGQEPPLITWQMVGGVLTYSISLWGAFNVWIKGKRTRDLLKQLQQIDSEYQYPRNAWSEPDSQAYTEALHKIEARALSLLQAASIKTEEYQVVVESIRIRFDEVNRIRRSQDVAFHQTNG